MVAALLKSSALAFGPVLPPDGPPAATKLKTSTPATWANTLCGMCLPAGRKHFIRRFVVRKDITVFSLGPTLRDLNAVTCCGITSFTGAKHAMLDRKLCQDGKKS